ncbi:hypothetical protein ACFE04_013653 [Oxalis oulophora]
MEEDDDRVLLNSLGVTSANPEDIERRLLEQVTKNVENVDEGGKTVKEYNKTCEKLEGVDEASSEHQAKLLNKLRAVQFEINAVASTIDDNHSARAAAAASSGIKKDEKEDENVERESRDDSSSLQQALAADRLESLKKTKALLEKEITDFKPSTPIKVDKDKLLQNLVKEEFRPKRKLKEVEKKDGKTQKKKKKAVSFEDDADFDALLDAASAGFVETERDELVRKGILTPFHKLKGFERGLQHSELPNGQNLPDEGTNSQFASASIDKAARSLSEAARARPTTKLLGLDDLPKLDAPTNSFQRLKTPLKVHLSAEDELEKKRSKKKKKRPLPDIKWRKRLSNEDKLAEDQEDSLGPDKDQDGENSEDIVGDEAHETSFVALEGGLKIPETIFKELFEYQKVGVQWLWELHCQKAGGIIGDEMGLGKTVQVLSFLGSLHFSKMYKPSIVICPVTLLRQWRREAKKWYPSFRVKILHDSAQDSSRGKISTKTDESDYDSEDSNDSDFEKTLSSNKSTKRWDLLINQVLKSDSGLLITTYEQLRILGDKLLDIEWGYAILDEGHRIRNPNAEVTLVCKQLQTVHRIIMTGSPIQNKLTELWSLFDFVFPGKLGVLPVFEAEFSVPISIGGYANASPLQVSTAYRCAVVLRDLIMPYLLRRMKADISINLPKKIEHVLFCSLTTEQRSVYRAFLASSEVENILEGSRNSLSGIDVMRKICNHPDLLEREHSYNNPDYGNPERSGKMKVVDQVLKGWKEQGHRVLLFTQTQQMLDILENYLISLEYNYRRMDGLTPVRQRMSLIDEFNNSEDVFIFILTTKVGGLGTNLTGANRVIIFDPDWNPSTDMQARERAWRIGQKRDVTVYRLITRGTIEEKVYHRQIYKQFLTNKILKNPQQRRFFKSRDLKDLFTLNDDVGSGSTETSSIFGQVVEDINVLGVQKDQIEPKQNKSTSQQANDDRNNSEKRSSRSKGKEKTESNDKEEGDEETNILKSLFEAQGIHSAMNHDAIMNAQDEEKFRLEEQASQVAQRASEALRQSRMLRSRESVSVPTWTGRSGTAGAPSSVRRKFGSTVNSQLVKSSGESSSSGASKRNGFSAGTTGGKALSSAELLSRIQGNQERADAVGLEHQLGQVSSSSNGARPQQNTTSRSASSRTPSSVQPEVLIRRICTFMQERGGATDSARIVGHFKDTIPPSDLPLFKNLLKEVATLEKKPNGSVWVLKPEFVL